MIKVYLDWNCITHCKDSFVELRELLEHYNYVFICPFTEAHIRDVQRKADYNSEYYQKDLDLLTQISGINMLNLNGKKLELNKVSPRECITKHVGAYDRIIDLLTPVYKIICWVVKSKINPKDLSHISKVDRPEKVIPLINDIMSKDPQVTYNFDSLMKNFSTSVDFDLVSKVRQVYYFLDILGYKKEKERKSLANIDTDAQHIALATLCDYLISDDDKMREKAKVIYGQTHCATIVLSPREFMDKMPEISKKCMDIDRIPDIMQKNGFPIIKEDGAHYREIDSPLWGSFNYCLNASSISNKMPQNEAFFVTDQYMFYDELRPLVNNIFYTLPDSQRNELAESYAQSFIKSIPFKDIKFTVDSPKYRYTCILKKYNNLPAIHVKYSKVKQ